MKIILIVLILAGCGDYFTAAMQEKATSLCADNGGFSKAYPLSEKKLHVYCNNGAVFVDVIP